MAITPKEGLIQAIERSPDELVRALLELLKVLQWQSAAAVSPKPQESVLKAASSRLHRKQGVLVIETEPLNGLDTNAILSEVREEQIQYQTRQADS
ncbi:MAG: hypothetical protein HC833_01565 [Leptolyngbyaceae cyanobacterium RM1_406_9]|nr:hypothetical protein [Leptolyngbyaceae cyanobacterium RM1_406_9]